MILEFQKATIQDVELLSNISRTTFVDAFESQNSPKDFKAYINQAFSIKTLLEQLQTEGTSFYFSRVDSQIVGYFKINEFDSQTELQEINGIELERIYITKEFQSKGLGLKMLIEVEAIAKQKGKKYIWLGVWEHNLKAIKFYERHGFLKFDTHPYYIGEDKQNDWLMKKKL